MIVWSNCIGTEQKRGKKGGYARNNSNSVYCVPFRHLNVVLVIWKKKTVSLENKKNKKSSILTVWPHKAQENESHNDIDC